jgi:hypothetical protein
MSNDGSKQNQSDAKLYKYGLIVAVVGIAAIMAAFFVALVRLTASGDVATAASAMFAAVGTLAGAYFGFHAGSAGRQAAENGRYMEAKKSQRLAAIASDPEKADRIINDMQ